MEAETINTLLNILSVLVLIILGKFGYTVADKSTSRMETATNDQTTKIVDRLVTMERRMNNHDRMHEETSTKMDILGETVDHVATVVDETQHG